MGGVRRKKDKLWRPSHHEEFPQLGYASGYAEAACMWEVWSVANFVCGNVSHSLYKLAMYSSDIVEMQVVKA